MLNPYPYIYALVETGFFYPITNETMSPLTRRQHIILRLVVVPMASLLAAHVVFQQVFPGQKGYHFPWAYFLTVATVMLSCWEVNLGVFRWLDSYLPFDRQPIRRLIAQIVLGGSATLLTFALAFPLAQRLYTSHWPSVPTVLKGIVVCITLASLVNGGYAGLYLLQAFYAERGKNKTAQASAGSELLSGSNQPAGAAGLVAVDTPTGQVRLPMDQIAYFYSARGLVLLVKNDGQQVITRYSSFPGLLPTLDTHYFFHLNRQYVVSAGAVRAVQDAVNRKLIVTLVPALRRQDTQQAVMVSRYRSLELKKWLRVLPAS